MRYREQDIKTLDDDSLAKLYSELKTKLKSAEATDDEALLWVPVNKEITRRTTLYRKQFLEHS